MSKSSLDIKIENAKRRAEEERKAMLPRSTNLPLPASVPLPSTAPTAEVSMSPKRQLLNSEAMAECEHAALVAMTGAAADEADMDATGIQAKPPLGLMPRYLWREHRLDAVDAAIKRYEDAGLVAPGEWVDERKQLQVLLGLRDEDMPSGNLGQRTGTRRVIFQDQEAMAEKSRQWCELVNQSAEEARKLGKLPLTQLQPAVPLTTGALLWKLEQEQMNMCRAQLAWNLYKKRTSAPTEPEQ